MRFTPEQEDAFYSRRDELLEDFQTWLASSQATEVPQLAEAEPDYASVALDWKWGYGDGDLGRWTVADLEEFLLSWCPRKLSVPAEECEDIPGSIRSFLTFLASRGLLGRGSSPLGQLQRCCEGITARFVAEMGNPANYGLAKGLFAQVGGLEAGLDLDEDMLDAVLARMQGMPVNGSDLDTHVQPIRTVGPVTPPEENERSQAAAAAPALIQLQQLREFCAPPGRQLTQKGNLRLADARSLVELLDTGDVPDAQWGDYRRSLRSAEDLPVLSWLVELGIQARALRRHRGRLVAVARWSQLSAVEAVDRLVDAAIEVGLSGSSRLDFPGLFALQEFVDAGVGRLLAELLDARTAAKPLPIEELVDLVVGAASRRFGGMHSFHLSFVPSWVRHQLDRLAALGVLTVRDVARVTTEWGATEAHGGVAELTPAGVPIAARLAKELGIVVLARPDPATATAQDLVQLLERMEPETWLADARSWVAHRGPEQAAQELTTVLNDTEISPAVVLAALGQLDKLVGEHAIPAMRTMLTGPHDGLAMHLLLDAGAVDPSEVDPDLLLRSGIELMIVAYEVGGLDDLLTTLETVSPELIDMLWRTDHPRVAELLELIGTHHPDKQVAKSARRSLLRYRSRVASRR